MKCTVNKVILKIDKELKDIFKTKGGLLLYYGDATTSMSSDGEFHQREKQLTTWGIVKAVPSHLNSRQYSLYIGDGGKPHTYDRFHVEVKPGDKVHFRYTVNNRDDAKLIEGEFLYECWYDNLLAIEKEDGTLVPICGKVLIEPLVEKIESPSKSLYIPSEFLKREYEDRGTVIAIGSPIKDGEDPGFKAGDKVIISKTAEKYDFGDNRMYLVVYHNEVLVIVDKWQKKDSASYAGQN